VKTPDSIITNACIELALVLAEQTAVLLATERQSERFQIRQNIIDISKKYDFLIKLVG
jgi:hypothetical protein